MKMHPIPVLALSLALLAEAHFGMDGPVTAQAPGGSTMHEPAAYVSAGWLAGKLGQPQIAILDARPSLRDYLAGHIPGAQPLGVENVRAASGGVPGEILPPDVLATLAGRLGIGDDSHVVVYGAGSDPDATLVASAMILAGSTRVSVLDGGMELWKQEGGPVTTERKPVRQRKPAPAPGGPLLASLDDVKRAVAEKTAVLVDARPREQYMAGRIPGAVSRYWGSDLNPEGRSGAGLLRPASVLEKEYADLGVTRDRPAIVYCNTGHMASAVFYTLRYRLGFPRVTLYDGSWLEWSMYPELPRESGPAAPPE